MTENALPRFSHEIETYGDASMAIVATFKEPLEDVIRTQVVLTFDRSGNFESIEMWDKESGKCKEWSVLPAAVLQAIGKLIPKSEDDEFDSCDIGICEPAKSMPSDSSYSSRHTNPGGLPIDGDASAEQQAKDI